MPRKKCTPDYYLPSWQIKCRSSWTVKKVQLSERMEAESQYFQKNWLKEYQDFTLIYFASRLNFPLKSFISWGPDPEAMELDAFTVNWNRWINVYAFPPFGQIWKAICKLEEDLVDGLFILSNWPTAVRFPQMMRLLTGRLISVPKGKRTLQLMHTDSAQPLHRRLQLLAMTLSGKPSKHKDIMDELRRSSTKREYASYLKIWKVFCIKETVIPFDQL